MIRARAIPRGAAICFALTFGKTVVHADDGQVEVPSTPASLTILYHGDVDGRLAQPRCAAGKVQGPPTANYAQLVGAIDGARKAAIALSQPAPLVLLGGNLASPALLGRVLLEGPDGANHLSEIFARAGYDAVALGHHDLSLEPSRLEQLIDGLSARALPVVATNLVCDPGRAELCRRTRRYLLVRRGPFTVAVLATISPTVLSAMSVASRTGLRLLDPLTTIRNVAREARAHGATRLVVMTQGPRDARGLDETDSLQRGLGRTANLLLAGGLADDETGSALREMRRDDAPLVVGAPQGASGLARVLLWANGPASTDTAEQHLDAPTPAGDDTNVANQDGMSSPAGPDPLVTDLLLPALSIYCARYGVAISPARLSAPLTRTAFTSYALEVMRRRGRAEIALLNRGAVKRLPFPIVGTITAGDLSRALPYDVVIGVARMSGAAIEDALGPALTNSRLAVAGLSRGSDGWQVNGRALDKTRAYRVATIDFVATGGDGIVGAHALPWVPLEGNPNLRDTLESFLRLEGKGAGPGAAEAVVAFDPNTDLGPPLERRPLVVGLTDVGADFANTHISNGPGYGDTQLTRAEQQVLKGEATGLLQVRHPVHEADTRLNLKYGWTRNQLASEVATAAETTDLITFSTVYNYKGLRGGFPKPRPVIPDPYVRAGLESEFTRPDVTPTQTRTFHHLELTNTGGALFTLTPALKLRGGAGLRKELLTAVPPTGRWRPLIELGAALSPVALTSVGQLSVKIEGLLDYNFVDPAGVREHQLRLGGKLSVPLLPLLFVTAGLDMFAVQRERQGWGASYDTTVGLRVHMDGAHQWM